MLANYTHLCPCSRIHLVSVLVGVYILMSLSESCTALRTLVGSKDAMGLMSRMTSSKFTQAVISDVDVSSNAFFSGLIFNIIT